MFYYEKKARRKGFRFIVGIDEAGRGPLAGPVVAAAVLIGKSNFNEKIDDSKRLSPLRREKAFFEIMRTCLVSIGAAHNPEIDEINILNATKRAMERAVLGLGIKPDYLLIDGRISLNLPIRQQGIVKGDGKSLSIAAASIVAKVARDAMMLEFDGKYPKYMFARHKGYCTRQHVFLLREIGPCPIHRRSFEPIFKLIKGRNENPV
ncbi:MAG: ribonuclease HII [Candidatus Omnitrophica bacterium]|nr:ribonuclease HII [Candidatus Omnitrophota bacterium]